MSQQPSLSQRIRDRFCAVFGEPDNTLGRDDHWALQPTDSRLSIHLLLNGTRDVPALWIFDPFDRDDAVFRQAIVREDEAEGIIAHIQDRVNRAGQSASSA